MAVLFSSHMRLVVPHLLTCLTIIHLPSPFIKRVMMQPVRKHSRSGSSAVSAQRPLFPECLFEGAGTTLYKVSTVNYHHPQPTASPYSDHSPPVADLSGVTTIQPPCRVFQGYFQLPDYLTTPHLRLAVELIGDCVNIEARLRLVESDRTG